MTLAMMLAMPLTTCIQAKPRASAHISNRVERLQLERRLCVVQPASLPLSLPSYLCTALPHLYPYLRLVRHPGLGEGGVQHLNERRQLVTQAWRREGRQGAAG